MPRRVWVGRDRVIAWLEGTAEFWLGYSIAPVARVVSQSGWEPDGRGSYCGRCGATVGPGEAGADGCVACRGRPGIADGMVRLGAYSGQLRDWVLDIKYRHRWEEMAEFLGGRLGRQVAGAGVVDAARSIIVPMPMPWPRRLSRGIDHARVIARGAGRALGAREACLLARTNEPPQVALSRTQRLRGGGRGIRLRRGLASRSSGFTPATLARRHVVLVDDVVTTGATMRAAARWLRRLGPERVVAAVIAVADEPGRRAPSRLAGRPG